MSKGHIIFTEEILDREALTAYTMAAVPSVIAAGGPKRDRGSPPRTRVTRSEPAYGDTRTPGSGRWRTVDLRPST